MRHYAITVGKARVESANAETNLGKLWLVGEPLLFIAVYGTIFGVILEADRGVDNFIGFLASGQILFRHCAQSMQNAGQSMSTFAGQIQTMPVPRALFPISSVTTSFFTQVPSFVVMLLLLSVTGSPPRLAWVFIIFVIGGQIVLNAGVGMILARAIAHVPDLSHIFTHVFRSLLYGSGVVFPIDGFLLDRNNGEFLIKALVILNPIYDYLTLGRWALMGDRPPFPVLSIVAVLAWSLGTAIIGLLWLRRVELRYGFGQIRNAP